MKRSLSILLAVMIAITNVVFITMPSVSAAAGDVLVSDNFETGYTPISSNAAATFDSMKELLDMNPWWYSAKATVSSTVFNKADDVTENTPLIASVVGAGENNVLRLTYHAEAGIGTNIINPEKANYYVYENDSYEVSFKFYATKDMQILGIGGKQENGNAIFYKNNILTKTGNGAYMGDTEATSPAGVGGAGVESNKWYTLKIVVNNGLGYYSVEVFDENGTSLQRTGGINFQEGCPGIANIRFQAPTADSVVYIDDYVSKKVDPDALLYEDDFNIYTGFSGTTTAGANLFKEISQFRVQNTASAYGLGTNDTGKYFVLNKNANAIYMPWNGHILTKDSQAARGKLQMKFSFSINEATSPTKTTASFRVICADNLTSIANLADAKYTMFRVQPFSSGGKIVYGMQKDNKGNDDIASYQQVNKSKWYDVELTFDLANDKVTMVAAESGTTAKITFERSTGLYNGGTALDSIKGIMFHANDGMIIGIDDVEIKYVDMPVVEKPQLSVKVPEVTDFDGNKIVDVKSVNPALSTIKLTFNSPITDESAKNISLKSSAGVFTNYTTTNENGVYTMNFNKTLTPNTKYVITVPTTVTSTDGATLNEEYTCEFMTSDGKAQIEMTAVNIDSVSDVTNGGKIYARIKYANSKIDKADCLLIAGFYGANNTMLGSSYYSASIPARDMKTSFDISVDVPAAEKLDLSKVERVSVYIWDSYSSLIPYCASINIVDATGDNE